MPEQNKDPIKEAFAKAKQDIFSLAAQTESLKREIHSLKEFVKTLINNQTIRQTHTSTHSSTGNPTEHKEKPAQNPQTQTIQHINPTESSIPAHNPTQNQAPYGLKSQNSNFSTGNDGVPADRQTDQQTDNSTGNTGVKVRLNQNTTDNATNINNLTKVTEIVNSLDSLKKELRSKIKKLTKQEMLVFTTIYQLEEQALSVDYFNISEKLKLTESSIRDYVQRIIKKGFPLVKTKENNKKVLLSISQDLRKIASLSTIIQLREI